MSAKATKRKSSVIARPNKGVAKLDYRNWSGGITALLEEARQQSARHINAILTATYWEIGRRIAEYLQAGEERADYGDEMLERLSTDLTKKFGRGFSRPNLQQMKKFYQQHPTEQICQTVSAKLEIYETPSRNSAAEISLYLEALCHAFPLS